MIPMLEIVSALILEQNVIRVVEFLQGRGESLLSVEWPIYVFDALVMAPTTAVSGWWYLSSIMARSRRMEVRTSLSDNQQNRVT